MNEITGKAFPNRNANAAAPYGAARLPGTSFDGVMTYAAGFITYKSIPGTVAQFFNSCRSGEWNSNPFVANVNLQGWVLPDVVVHSVQVVADAEFPGLLGYVVITFSPSPLAAMTPSAHQAIHYP